MTLGPMAELARPFPDRLVHTNPAGGGSYIKHHVIEQRLIQVLGIPPHFTLVEIVRGNVAAIQPNPQANSKRAKEGRPELVNVVVAVIARMQASIDSETVIVDEAGDCESPHNWDTDGQRLKDAFSDAYKRCAMRLGCALHLWSQEEYFLFDKLSQEQGVAEDKPKLLFEDPQAQAELMNRIADVAGSVKEPKAAETDASVPTSLRDAGGEGVGGGEATDTLPPATDLVAAYGDGKVLAAARRLAKVNNIMPQPMTIAEISAPLCALVGKELEASKS